MDAGATGSPCLLRAPPSLGGTPHSLTCEAESVPEVSALGPGVRAVDRPRVREGADGQRRLRRLLWTEGDQVRAGRTV